MIKLFCGILAVAMIAGVATAYESVGIEVRKSSVIGSLGVMRVQVETKAEADGSVVVSFQAPEEGTYFLAYSKGPDRGKIAKIVRVQKAGPVTAKIKSSGS